MIWIRDKWDKVTLSSTQKIDIKIHNRRCWVSRLFPVAWKPIFELKGSGQCYVSLPGRKAQSQANIVVVSISPPKILCKFNVLANGSLALGVREVCHIAPWVQGFSGKNMTDSRIKLDQFKALPSTSPCHCVGPRFFFFFKFYLIWECARWHVGS